MDRGRSEYSVHQENTPDPIFSVIQTFGRSGTAGLAPITGTLSQDRSPGASHVQEVCLRCISSAQGKRRVASSRRPASSQPALHPIALPVRDIKGSLTFGQTRRLDVCVRSTGRLSLRKHSSSTPEVLHVPGKRGVLPVCGSSFRMVEQSLCIYQGDETGSRVPAGSSSPHTNQAAAGPPCNLRPLQTQNGGNSGPALPGRFHGHNQQLPGRPRGSSVHQGYPQQPRPAVEREEVPLDPNPVSDPPGSPSRYGKGPFSGDSSKDEKVASTGERYFVSSSPVATVRPSEAAGPVHGFGKQYPAGRTTSQILPKGAIRRNFNQDHVGQHCTVNTPGTSRHQLVAKLTRQELGQSFVEDARNSHSSLRRVRFGLGRRSQRLRTRPRVLAASSEAAPHHVERALCGQTHGGNISSSATRQASETVRRQPICGGSFDQAHIKVHSAHGRTQKAVGIDRLSSDRAASRIHSLRGQRLRRQVVQTSTTRGLEAESQQVRHLRQKVGTAHAGSLCNLQQSAGSKIQFRVSRTTVIRGRRFCSGHYIMASGEQLGQPPMVIAKSAGAFPGGFRGSMYSSGPCPEGTALVQAVTQHYRGTDSVSSHQGPVSAGTSGLLPAPGHPFLGCHGVQSASQAPSVKEIFLQQPVAHRPQKYTCTTQSTLPAPWHRLIQQVAATRYGSLVAPEVNALLQAWVSSLSPATYSGYFSKFKKFAEFCLERNLSPLPAQDATVELFLGWMLAEGRVSANLFPQYLSAIRAVHRDLLLPLPNSSVMSLITQGGRHLQKSISVTQESYPLPADAVVEFILTGLAATDISQVRALCAISVAFAFCCRGSTGQGMLFQDFSAVYETHSLTLVESVRKGHTHQDSLQRTLVVDVSKLHTLLHLVKLFQAMQSAAFGSDTNPTHFWQLPGEDLSKGSHFDKWFYECLELVPVSVPLNFKLHPHCVRKGAGSAARAIGVTLEKICRLGGWKLGSKSVWQYIDPMVKPTKGAALFFGWLLPTPVDTLLNTV